MNQNLVCVLATAALLCGCGKESALSEAPVESSKPYQGASENSRLVAVVRLPLSDVTAALSKAVPSVMDVTNKTEHACKDFSVVKGVGGAICGDVVYSYHLAREGMSVTPVPGRTDMLRVSAPLSLRGKGFVNGDVGRAIGGKSFAADTAIRLDFGLSVDGQGCPVVTMETDYNWTSHPRVEIAENVWVNIDDAGNNTLKKILNSTRDQVQTMASCARFKELVAKAWKQYSFEVPVPDQPPAAVLVTPTRLAIASWRVTNDEVTLGVAVDAQTAVAVGNAPAVTVPPPLVEPLLPVVSRTPSQILPVPMAPGATASQAAGPSQLRVVLPIYADYKELTKRAQVWSNTSFTFQVAGKESAIQLLESKIYPAGDSLAIGAKIKTKLPGRILDTTGWVYLTGKPALTLDGNYLTVADLQFARQLDNEFWTAATYAFQDAIRNMVTRLATADLREPRANAAKALQTAVNEKGKGDGYSVRLDLPQLKLNKVVIAQQLVFEPQLDATFDIQVDAKKLAAMSSR